MNSTETTIAMLAHTNGERRVPKSGRLDSLAGYLADLGLDRLAADVAWARECMMAMEIMRGNPLVLDAFTKDEP